MKVNLLIIALFIFNVSNGQTNKRTTDEEKLNKCILEKTNYFTFSGQRPIGKGWDTLENIFAQNQFVGWGEYHNSPLLSQLTSYALESASNNGFKTWCIETSPFIASELSLFAKNKNPSDTILKIAEKFGIPFFRTKEDALMLAAANKFNFSIWGLDQEFQVTFPYCISKVYNSQPALVKQKYKAVFDSLM